MAGKRMHSAVASKEQLLELIDNWDHSLDDKLGKPVWEQMGWTKVQFREWIKNRKDV